MALKTTALRLFSIVSLAVFLGAGRLDAQVKENLDLPFDAVGDSEDEEEAPEVVSFYSVNLEGDGFFYVIDKSGSMTEQGELARAKQECLKNLREFSNRVWFGIVFFDGNVSKFPSNGQPARADPAMKQQASSFVQAAAREARGSCCKEGLLAGLKMANMSKPRRKVLVYLGDGGTNCGGVDPSQYMRETLSAVLGANYQRCKINTIGVLDVRPENENFLKQLAAQNAGTYTRIN
jgi:Mg-chelatase subunit ChlD